MEQCLIT